MAELYRRAESKLRNKPKTAPEISGPDPRALLHELQVYQVELEMQNSALQESQELLEQTVERFTDLYDFAPVAYFTLDAGGVIQQANLAGSRLIGIDRIGLIGRDFSRSLVSKSRPRFVAFLHAAFHCETRQTGEFELLLRGAKSRSVCIDAQCTIGKGQCRLVAVDLTERKRAEEARTRLEVVSSTNRKLELEIVHREEVEKSLRRSEHHYRTLLAKSNRLQNELRRVSHLILETQEEERRRISRELHDQITQTLVNISFHLESLSSDSKINPGILRNRIVDTQTLVEESIEIVHQFARDLRPPALDHLGLIPAIKALVSEFITRTEIQANFIAFPEVENANSGQRTAIYRVVQSALSNVAKHSEAKTVDIEIRKVARNLCLTVRDDGKSFDKRRLRYAKGDRRLGLLGMRERVEMVGGKFEIRSRPGVGTAVEAHIPLGSSLSRIPVDPKPKINAASPPKRPPKKQSAKKMRRGENPPAHRGVRMD
jgi:signal transduction histidine kinase